MEVAATLLLASAHQPTHLFTDVTKRASQDTVGTGLPSKRLSNNHEPVTHNHHLIDLPTGGGGGAEYGLHNYTMYVHICT